MFTHKQQYKSKHFPLLFACGKLILINAIGQKVYEQKIIKGTNEINTNGLSFGLYNYVLFQDDQKIISGKLVIE